MQYAGGSAFRSGLLKVCDGILLTGRIELFVLEGGTLTALRYRSIIHDPYIVTLANYICDVFVLMNDNARPVTECLVTVQIGILDWPAYSSDLNQIKRVWNMMKRRLRQLQPSSGTLHSLMGSDFPEGHSKACHNGARGGRTRY